MSGTPSSSAITCARCAAKSICSMVCAAAAAATQRLEIASQANCRAAASHDMARGCVRVRSSRSVHGRAPWQCPARIAGPRPSIAGCMPAGRRGALRIDSRAWRGHRMGRATVRRGVPQPVVAAVAGDGARWWLSGAQRVRPTPSFAHAPAQGAGVDAEPACGTGGAFDDPCTGLEGLRYVRALHRLERCVPYRRIARRDCRGPRLRCFANRGRAPAHRAAGIERAAAREDERALDRRSPARGRCPARRTASAPRSDLGSMP